VGAYVLRGVGANRSPHTGHSIRWKSMRRTSAGEITFPHFGHTASRDACTFSKLTLLALTIPAVYGFRFSFATKFALWYVDFEMEICLWQE
jgi:hypothetical protein